MANTEYSVSPDSSTDSPLKRDTPSTPFEHYSPNNSKYYNDHLNKSQFNSILVNCALRLVKLSYNSKEVLEEHKLRFFIVEILRRSKTTIQSLQICCYYLYKIINHKKVPEICPKKMFLGMLILASKFNQDHNYSFKSWLKICGCKEDDNSSSLNLRSLKETEIICLQLLDYNLCINGMKYENWCNVLLIFGYDFISLHQVPLGVLTWCDRTENAEKMLRWRKFLSNLEDAQLTRNMNVHFKQYYANQIGTKVVTTSFPTPDSLFKKRSLEADESTEKRACV